ncbi:MAG TPA: long-chain fatty acid--CoA ligase [Myxococcales bacterium]|nr:long-chain fatty acid--CoA ligase [Myxococcales bacterium]
MARVNDLVELYRRSCTEYAARPLFGTKRDGAWTWMSYAEFGALVDQVRGGLAGLGVGKSDRVACIADNCIEWAAAAYATYGLGASFVPMYQSQRPAEWEFILGDCGAKVVFVANETIFTAVEAMHPRLPQLAHVIGFSRPATAPDSWRGLVQAGAKAPVPADAPSPHDIAGFIYTSGTTGKPKGVLLSHENIASNLNAVHEIFPLNADDRSLAFLPWAHAFGQTCELHMILSFGASMALNDDVEKLVENIAVIRPTVLVAVPRIFNKIYGLVNQQIAARPPLLKKIIQGGLQSAMRRARGERLGLIDRLELAFDDKVVFSKIRARFGGRLKYVISGSATLGRDVAQFIDAVGLPVYEGYGLTETSPIVTANVPGSRRMGSVGRVVPGVRVVIDTGVTGHERDGEILVYGPNVMIGYHRRPEDNEKTLTPDGGLRTGDLGHLDEDGFLYINGRIKEQFKLENGKYVMPSSLEEVLKLSPYISNVMIHGDGRPFNVALIVINEPAVRAWAGTQGIALGSDATAHERVRSLIRGELERLGGEFRRFEAPRDFVLIREDFTIQNGQLTPTLKLKRNEVLARYAGLLEALYAKQPEAQPQA